MESMEKDQKESLRKALQRYDQEAKESGFTGVTCVSQSELDVAYADAKEAYDGLMRVIADLTGVSTDRLPTYEEVNSD